MALSKNSRLDPIIPLIYLIYVIIIFSIGLYSVKLALDNWEIKYAVWIYVFLLFVLTCTVAFSFFGLATRFNKNYQLARAVTSQPATRPENKES